MNIKCAVDFDTQQMEDRRLRGFSRFHVKSPCVRELLTLDRVSSMELDYFSLDTGDFLKLNVLTSAYRESLGVVLDFNSIIENPMVTVDSLASQLHTLYDGSNIYVMVQNTPIFNKGVITHTFDPEFCYNVVQALRVKGFANVFMSLDIGALEFNKQLFYRYGKELAYQCGVRGLFKKYGSYVRNISLSRLDSDGNKLGFSVDDRDALAQVFDVMSAYKSYSCASDITVDVPDATEAEKTLEACVHICGKLGIGGLPEYTRTKDMEFF